MHVVKMWLVKRFLSIFEQRGFFFSKKKLNQQIVIKNIKLHYTNVFSIIFSAKEAF